MMPIEIVRVRVGAAGSRQVASNLYDFSMMLMSSRRSHHDWFQFTVGYTIKRRFKKPRKVLESFLSLSVVYKNYSNLFLLFCYYSLTDKFLSSYKGFQRCIHVFWRYLFLCSVGLDYENKPRSFLMEKVRCKCIEREYATSSVCYFQLN